MASPNMRQPFIPEQARAILKNKVDAYERTGGKVTAQFASTCVAHVLPFTEGSVIHDNACGSGTVSAKILSSHPPKGIRIFATDQDEDFVSAYKGNITEEKWPADVGVMKCEKLDFPDHHFTHSFTNIAIFMTANGGLDAAKEIHRTLKPGGTATVNCWEFITWMLPMKEVHEATRPDKPWPTPPLNWSDGKQLWKIMEEAGFKEEHMKKTTSEAWAVTTREGLRSWAETSWAYLGGLGGWSEHDEERWAEAVELLETKLKVAEGTSMSETGEVKMLARQHVLIATKG